jgi:hypothetical protein
MINSSQRSFGRAMLLALGTAVAGAWLLWPRVATLVTSRFVTPPVAAPAVSADLAEATLDRFEAFRAGRAGERLAMSDAELSSVVRYAIPGILPPGVSEPEATIDGGSLALSARVATQSFPDLPALDQAVGVFPDTVSLRMEGELAPFGKESLIFRVRHIEAGPIPLPGRLIPRVLTALGRRHRDGLPWDALHLQLPSGLSSVYVLEDSLVLVVDR